jgi:proteasome activator subunit 4
VLINTEQTNSNVVDDRLIEMFANMAEEHVAGKAGRTGPEGGAAWQDVGIFTEAQWTVLVGKCLGSFREPLYEILYSGPNLFESPEFRCSRRFNEGK